MPNSTSQTGRREVDRWTIWQCKRHPDYVRVEPPPPGELPYCPLAKPGDMHKMERAVIVVPEGEARAVPDGDAVERVARAIEQAAFYPSKLYEVRVSWGYPGEPDRGNLDVAAISRIAAEAVVNALSGGEG